MVFLSSQTWRNAGRIACMTAALVASMEAEAGQVRYNTDGHAENPSFSKDGKFLAFEVNNLAGDVKLFVAGLKGDIANDGANVALPGGSNPFGGSGQVVINASWHPQGLVVFEGSNQSGQYRLYYHQPGGGAAQEMITSAEVPGNLSFPTIAPDGRFMAFVASVTGNGDIRTRDTNTGKIGQVTTTNQSEMFPLFSSDGKKILYTRKENNSEDVYEAPLAGGDPKSLAGGGGDQTRPTYAGSWVLFFDNGRNSAQWDIVGVDAAGAKKTFAKGVRLPLRARPAVDPSGEWLAFAYDDPTQADKVVLMKLDGSKTTDVSGEGKACGEPAFGIQNGRVLLAFTALPSSGSDWRFLRVADVTDKVRQ